MNCHDFDVLMQEELDGELTPSRRAMLDEHCQACTACQRTREGYARLRRATGLLPEVKPQQDLWTGIAARLDTAATPPVLTPFPKTRRAPLPWARLLMAACLAAGVLGLALFQLRPERIDPATTAQNHPVEDPVKTMEREYKKARAEFLAAMQGPESNLTAETMQTVTENLAVIDTAVAQIQDALVSDPANPNLIGLLVATRDKEMEMLSALAQFTSAS